MSGICGWIDFDRDLTEPSARQVLAEMTTSLGHRGPDYQGTWINGPAAFGHQQLTIIDSKGSRQPMILQDDGRPAFALVYDGATYNCRELRQLLITLGHRFETGSDPEVVLHAYDEWGRNDPCAPVSALNGMFAYALWNCVKRELLLVRDRLGVKPLYYYPTNNGVLFSSEPKSILANGLAQRCVDADGLRLALGLVADPENAVFRGMFQVRPGHIIRVTRDGIQQMAYWRLTEREHTDDLPTTVRHVRELLEDTVKRQLVADVPLCTLLSGGLDSSVLTALAARLRGEPLRSFSVDFDGSAAKFTPSRIRGTPDGPYARQVANFVGADHTEITLSARDLMDQDVRASVLHARDLPFTWGELDSSLYLLFRAIRPHSTVVLSGDSADSLFGGDLSFHDPAHVEADTFPWFGRKTNFVTRSEYLDPSVAKKLDLAAYLDY